MNDALSQLGWSYWQRSNLIERQSAIDEGYEECSTDHVEQLIRKVTSFREWIYAKESWFQKAK